MKKAVADACAGIWISRVAFFAFFGATACEIAACSLSSSPPPAEYVLGSTPAAKMGTLSQTGFPVVEVKRIHLPDYLDTTDILERRGNLLVPSSTGRWGERLSVGMTRALTASLAARLPHTVVTATPPIGRPTRQILVDVAAFEPRSDHQVVLVARWTIADGASYHVLVAKQVSLVEALAATDDGAVVMAMSKILEKFADGLAAGIESDLRAGNRRNSNRSSKATGSKCSAVHFRMRRVSWLSFQFSGNMGAVCHSRRPLRLELGWS